MATVGKNILEHLTTGMYSASTVIYREYIQNASDSIDKAIEKGIIAASEAEIHIAISSKERRIIIRFFLY